MCFHIQQTKDAIALEKRFNAKAKKDKKLAPIGLVSGFTYPQVPVITNTKSSEIELFYWGFLPSWTNDINFRKNTLNARIETLAEKPSYQSAINQRCLVLIDGFFEWQWLDGKGRNKQKYKITLPNEESFALAGLWNRWTDRTSLQTIDTFTIVTTQANQLMSEIHNSKKRMPMILKQEEESDWLQNKDINWNRNIELIANKITEPTNLNQMSLF